MLNIGVSNFGASRRRRRTRHALVEIRDDLLERRTDRSVVHRAIGRRVRCDHGRDLAWLPAYRSVDLIGGVGEREFRRPDRSFDRASDGEARLCDLPVGVQMPERSWRGGVKKAPGSLPGVSGDCVINVAFSRSERPPDRTDFVVARRRVPPADHLGAPQGLAYARDGMGPRSASSEIDGEVRRRSERLQDRE
jgi:hypothetical protein